MAQWRITEMSKLTKVSVRMLRYYDTFGLLKPSGRSANNYRWYSEHDLARLQQIEALKFFGFTLSVIKTMLQQGLSLQDHLSRQQKMLGQQAEYLQQAQQAIAQVIARMQSSDHLDWHDLVALIERYRMATDLKKTWAKSLSDEQFDVWVKLRQEFSQEFASWDALISEINEKRVGDPEGPDGERIVKAQMSLVNDKIKGAMSRLRSFNADLMRSVKAGTISELPLTPEGNLWLNKAILAYWVRRWEAVYKAIVANLSQDPEGAIGKKIAQEWRTIIQDMLQGTSFELAFGMAMWQEIARQKKEVFAQTEPVSWQEMMQQKVHIDIMLNPEAMAWIEKALARL